MNLFAFSHIIMGYHSGRHTRWWKRWGSHRALRWRKWVIVRRFVAIFVAFFDNYRRKKTGSTGMTSVPKFSEPPSVIDSVGISFNHFDDVTLFETDFVATCRIVVVQSLAIVGQATCNTGIKINLKIWCIFFYSVPDTKKGEKLYNQILVFKRVEVYFSSLCCGIGDP